MSKSLKLIIFIFFPSLLCANEFNERNRLCLLADKSIKSDQLDIALDLYKQVISFEPLDSNVHYNCGYLYTRLNDNKSAIASYQEALKLCPTYSHAKLGLSKALLACGHLTQGWPLFEHRFSDPQVMQRAFGYLNIDVQNYIGKKILLRSEWGLGDMIHFVRYAKLLHDAGAYVIVQSFDPLVPLFSVCPYIDRVIAIGDAIPANDIQIPMLSLPLIFKTTLETIPTPIPYLYAKKDLVQEWHDTLSTDQNLKIGICWHAKPIYLEEHSSTRRSIPLTFFNELNQLPLSIYSLQKEYGMEEMASLPHLKKVPDDFDQTHGRFMDTAALIMNLDLVISADTSIVHLAGALGKEVWVLLPYAPEWRWLPGVAGYETRSVWYPSMRLFGQKKPGDWKSVIDEVKQALEKKLHSHSKELKKG